MAPGNQADEIARLRQRTVELEAEIQRHRQTKLAGEDQLLLLADGMPVMMWITGADAQCSYVNRAWLEFRGRTLEEELGNGWADSLHPDDRDLCIEAFLKSFTARRAFRIQYRVRRADGEYSWVDDAGRPRYDQDGAFAGFIGAVTDIGDRRSGVFTPDEDSVRMVFSLTERERQVLVLIAEGKSTKEAAARLGISYKTADSHRSRILEKLGVHETASMVRYAIRAGLIEP